MRIYGYKKRMLNDEGLLSLSEVTIQANPTNLRRIAAFILTAADEMEQMKKAFGHKHYQHSRPKKKSGHPDIIIAR